MAFSPKLIKLSCNKCSACHVGGRWTNKNIQPNLRIFCYIYLHTKCVLCFHSIKVLTHKWTLYYKMQWSSGFISNKNFNESKLSLNEVWTTPHPPLSV